MACVILPCRSWLSKVVGKDEEALKNTTLYQEVALTFPTDYDKENPLTAKQGKLRLIDIQINQAIKSGTAEDQMNIQMLQD